jgi:hypothetical protein
MSLWQYTYFTTVAYVLKSQKIHILTFLDSVPYIDLICMCKFVYSVVIFKWWAETRASVNKELSLYMKQMHLNVTCLDIHTISWISRIHQSGIGLV